MSKKTLKYVVRTVSCCNPKKKCSYSRCQKCHKSEEKRLSCFSENTSDKETNSCDKKSHYDKETHSCDKKSKCDKQHPCDNQHPCDKKIHNCDKQYPCCDKKPYCCDNGNQSFIFNGIFVMNAFSTDFEDLEPIPDFEVLIPYTVRRQGFCVTLELIQTIQFVLLESAILIAVDGLLPPEFRPISARYVDFEIVPNSMEGHVFRDGSLRISGPCLLPLPRAGYNVLPAKVQYCVGPTFPLPTPNNILIVPFLTDARFGVNNFTLIDFREYYGLQFFNGRISVVTIVNFQDDVTQPGISVFNQVDIHGQHLVPQVPIGPVDDLLNFGLGTPEPTLAVNPLNPLNMVAAVQYFVSTEDRFTFLSVSIDGGLTWEKVNPFAFLPPPVPPRDFFGSGDPRLIFDRFGNLFYICVGFVGNVEAQDVVDLPAVIILSTDGGFTWRLVLMVSSPEVTLPGEIPLLDYPEVATGPGSDPERTTALWAVFTPEILNPRIVFFDQIAFFVEMSGLGIIKQTGHKRIPGTGAGRFGSVAIDSKGGALVTGIVNQSSLSSLSTGNSSIWITYNPCGIRGEFPPSVQWLVNSNVGSLESFPVQPTRRTWAHPMVIIDRFTDRFYLVYVDQPTPAVPNADTDIFLIYSDDKGCTWSQPWRLNNDTGTSTQFIPDVAIDPITRLLVVTWHDTRNSPDNTRAQLWGTVITQDQLPRIVAHDINNKENDKDKNRDKYRYKQKNEQQCGILATTIASNLPSSTCTCCKAVQGGLSFFELPTHPDLAISSSKLNLEKAKVLSRWEKILTLVKERNIKKVEENPSNSVDENNIAKVEENLSNPVKENNIDKVEENLSNPVKNKNVKKIAKKIANNFKSSKASKGKKKKKIIKSYNKFF